MVYEIVQYEIHSVKFRVEAESEGDAIAKLYNEESVEPVNEPCEFVAVAYEYGLNADEYPEIVRRLRELGLRPATDVVSSIASVTKVS